MELIGRTFIFAFCLLSACALPNLAPTHFDSDGIYQLIIAQMRSSFIATQELSPAEGYCASLYNNNTQDVSGQLTNQTNTCFENANKTTNGNNINANATMSEMRANLLILQNQLANCTALNETVQFLNCNIASFDYNLLILDSTNSQAYQVQAQIAINQTQVDLARQACVGSVITNAKTNLTIAANTYSRCLNNIQNQRDFRASFMLH